MTDDSYASPWQPIPKDDQDPHVRPNYYAFAAMAQILGSGNGTTQIAALPLSGISSDYTPYVRAYSIYTKGSLSGVVVINGKTSNASETDKQSLTIQISLPDYVGRSVFLSALTADGADSTEGMTWNGISFGSTDGKSSGTSSFAVIQVDNGGSATFSLRDSQAMVANIDYALGTRSAALPTANSPTGNSPTGAGKKSAALPTHAGAKTATFAGGLMTAIALATSFGSGISSATGSSSHLAKSGGMNMHMRTSWSLGLVATVLVTLILVLGRFN